MVKRKRNSIGQFITNKNLFEGIKSGNISSFIMNKISAIFMVIFFLLLVSPWLTLIIKSKQLKIFLYSLLNFYSEHFINDDEINGSKCKGPGDL